MIELVGTAIIILAALLTVQALFLFLQVLASLRYTRSTERSFDGQRPAVTVVIPAHNESISIANTISSIRSQLKAADRVLVVADNCSDDTASVADQAGAEVIERCDAKRIGKGYALDHGIQYLERSCPPDIIIFVDADCEIAPGSVDALAGLAVTYGRPVQSANLMYAPSSAPPAARIAQFAFKVKNFVRPLGSAHLGVPCQLTGTGMAFPWSIVHSADLATGHITEDVKVGADLAVAGHAPLFCPQAKVISRFAASVHGRRSQKERWEHGHLAMICHYVPYLFWEACKKRRIFLFSMALDMSIPPLSLFALLTSLLTGLALLLKVFGSSTGPVIICGLLMTLSVLAVWVAWYWHGRDIISARELLNVPLYALSSLPIIWRFVTGRQITWIRAERDHE
jgi:cellulose synthase/poly-beta-1,6-N-acetylglucosamine synthase-like glycosyltransferase